MRTNGLFRGFSAAAGESGLHDDKRRRTLAPFRGHVPATGDPDDFSWAEADCLTLRFVPT
jgi:hypothetical protein